MNNIIILGSGRSGTSMVAGTVASNGYYRGEKPIPITPSNPKGLFEDFEINDINEGILSSVESDSPFSVLRNFFSRDLKRGQMWLTKLPIKPIFFVDSNIERKIRSVVGHEPYCFKDPRFSYTLPIWRPFLTNVAYICVFRDPASTAESITRECRERNYLKNLNIDFGDAIDVWISVYSNILYNLTDSESWLFIHYEQVLTENGMDTLQKFIDGPINHSFPDKGLRKTNSRMAVPQIAENIYRELCSLANYKDQ